MLAGGLRSSGHRNKHWVPLQLMPTQVVWDYEHPCVERMVLLRKDQENRKVVNQRETD